MFNDNSVLDLHLTSTYKYWIVGGNYPVNNITKLASGKERSADKNENPENCWKFNDCERPIGVSFRRPLGKYLFKGNIQIVSMSIKLLLHN